MSATIILTCVTLMTLCTSPVSTATLTDFLEWHCGGYIQLSHFPSGSLSLSLTPEDEYSPNIDCEVIVRVHVHMKILVTFLYMDIDGADHCIGDYLSIYSGGHNTNTTISLGDITTKGKFCGFKTPDAMTSPYNNIKVRFVSDAGKSGRGFSLLLTAFHDGECNDQEFRCNNHRCVDEDLFCDDIDNCGDGSDLCQFPAYVIVCIVLLSLLLVVAILILAAVFWYRRKRKIQEENQQQNSWRS